MTHEQFYSIRMRASAGTRHISGAERITSADKLDATVSALVTRVRNRRTLPEQIVITIERIGEIQITNVTALNVVTVNTPDVSSGRSAASKLLQSIGVSEQAALCSLNLLGNGASQSGGAIRGAIIMDAFTGERLEPDRERGVRASRFDWTEEALDAATRKLAAIGLTHFRTREALALATKVAHAPGIVAELCWSDEPDYTAGYVASRSLGYVRFPILKLQDDPSGGRVLFVNRNSLDREAFIHYLQFEPVLIVNSGTFRRPVEPEQYFTLR